MTFTYKETKIDRYCVSIEQEKFESCFYVRAYEERGSQYYRIKENCYGTEKEANKRFNYLVRLYKKETGL